MKNKKLIRITTVPVSLEKLLEDQLTFMNNHYAVTAISAEKERLELFGKNNDVSTYHIELTRKITPLKDIKAVYKLYLYLKNENPFIVHTHTPKAGIVGMMASYFAGVPVRLHTVAGLPLMEARGTRRVILDVVEKLTYSFATKIYPNSKGLYDFILKNNFAKVDKMRIIGNGSSNGIDTNYFDPSLINAEDNGNLKKNLGIDDNIFVFIFVGRLVSDKGINELVGAFSKLALEFCDVALLLVGSFEEELDPLDSFTYDKIKSNPRIYSVGYQTDVRPYFAISNALAFPSYREGFPNVVLQAGSMGLPAIVSNINGCNEIIKDGINGIIVEPKDEISLHDAMQNLVDKNQLYFSMKERARESVVANYQRSVFWDALLEEYKSLM
ncbi:glycosyltransferase involved in cell wall biosynthesis [Dokdonia sp. Hel_I_63]|uniref:glycosyltransferase family 4 protein n=1 Tax=Dokdonia sp. Hel_I_63 TaxID=1249996 RepID=UPI00119BCBDE|nr:glycosyltransferase family 4 protein [Dokdonia sp. Hel_I_63]TVZ23007.1 glycosyltransferase involved in cell wall biosynthesis [Dokdonia sp. Hel_I_63]